ncbi:hypothetical protein [Psychromonas sp.]|uniref:hypothetical protein n=1 Tax=Psychromonas sp. TaxID=1884585 RepID=UPI003A9733AB
MFKTISGRSIISFGENEDMPLPFMGSGFIDDVYLKYFFHDVNAPLVITFSNAGEITSLDDLQDDNYSPWGFDFVKSYNVNVLSFSAIGKANWYRSAEFHFFIKSLSKQLKVFNEKLGYGGSMGAFAVSAFSNCLGINRQLLMNPISSLSAKLTPWETRFKVAKTFNWKGDFSDGAIAKAQNVIIYDPLFTLDVAHVRRYQSSIKLKLPGVGHSIPKHLQNLGLLKSIFEQFLMNNINIGVFQKAVRSRRYYDDYYKWMLSKQNTHLTLRRAEVLKRHKKLVPKATIDSAQKNISEADINLIRDIALRLANKNNKDALELMLLAQKFRPNGKLINQKVIEYNNRLK